MNSYAKIEKAIKKLRWYDISLLKSAMIFFTLFVLAVWPGAATSLLGIHWGWYLTLFLITVVPLMKKIYF